jgi:hypothetical protein
MDGTRTIGDIAEQFKVLRSSVYSIYHDCYDRGIPVRLKPARPGRKRGPEALNSLPAMIKTLPPDVRRWVIKQVPEGATLADLIRSIIVD